MCIKTLEAIFSCVKNIEYRENKNYNISKKFVMELNDYINLNMIGKSSPIMSTILYDQFNRKHNTNTYIGLDGLYF